MNTSHVRPFHGLTVLAIVVSVLLMTPVWSAPNSPQNEELTPLPGMLQISEVIVNYDATGPVR